MFCKIHSMALLGIDAKKVDVEVDVGNGLPGINLVGLIAAEVREARERVRVALRNAGCPLPAKKITVNLSPADLRKEGTAYDLPIAIGILCGLEMIPVELTERVCIIGEVGLNGEIRPVPGVLSCAFAAREDGMDWIIVPKANGQEAVMVDGINVFALQIDESARKGRKVGNLNQAVVNWRDVAVLRHGYLLYIAGKRRSWQLGIQRRAKCHEKR